MPTEFHNLRFHVTDGGAVNHLSSLAGPRLRGAPVPGEQLPYNSPEAAARNYLSRFLGADDRPALRSLTAPGSPTVVPDLQHLGTLEQPRTGTRLVRFQQTRCRIPIFGSLAVVELDENQQLVSLDAEVTEVKNVSPIATISQKGAIDAVGAKAGVSATQLANIDPPELTFYFQEQEGTWHLAWHLRKVPAAPPEFLEAVSHCSSHGHGIGRSPRFIYPALDYLVDAHSGDVLFYYSAQPMLDVPVYCKGDDEDNIQCDFMGRTLNPTGFELNDPLRSICTYELGLKDFDTTPLPANPVQYGQADWKSANKAAVSAHVNATIVYNFYKSVLVRDGIDDKGMELVSIIGCTYSKDEPPPEWHNAVWYNNRMWYGQSRDANGNLRSYSRFLDIIAHELTHGITENTSNLIYWAQSGALNESFSDIFGVIINNWSTSRKNPAIWQSVANWNWEIGPGLGGNGLPLRDLRDPARTGDPDHMRNYLHTLADNGGVHTNSNIHNKAAYNLLSAKGTNDEYLFPPEEVATLYYLCLARLNQTASFTKVLQVLLDVANTLYAGDAAVRQRKTDSIVKAYNAVGIK